MLLETMNPWLRDNEKLDSCHGATDIQYLIGHHSPVVVDTCILRMEEIRVGLSGKECHTRWVISAMERRGITNHAVSTPSVPANKRKLLLYQRLFCQLDEAKIDSVLGCLQTVDSFLNSFGTHCLFCFLFSAHPTLLSFTILSFRSFF